MGREPGAPIGNQRQPGPPAMRSLTAAAGPRWRAHIGTLWLSTVEAFGSHLEEVGSFGVKPLAAPRTPDFVGQDQHDYHEDHPTEAHQMERA